MVKMMYKSNLREKYVLKAEYIISIIMIKNRGSKMNFIYVRGHPVSLITFLVQ